MGKWYDREDIKSFLHSFYVKKLMFHLFKTYQSGKKISPGPNNIFKAFELTEPNNLKVVIIGKEPYRDGSAIGVAYGNVNSRSQISNSLFKILEKVELDFSTLKIDEDITLSTWSDQGVLLLNSALTVENSKPGSHLDPWYNFIKFFVRYISDTMPGTIFLLVGEEAQRFEKFDDFDLNKTCHIFKAEDPIQAVKQFRTWNCKAFKEINKILEYRNGKEFCIEW